MWLQYTLLFTKVLDIDLLQFYYERKRLIIIITKHNTIIISCQARILNNKNFLKKYRKQVVTIGNNFQSTFTLDISSYNKICCVN